MDIGRYLVEAHLREGRSVAELAAQHGIHRSWMAGWMWIPMILVVALLVLGTVAVASNMSGGPSQADDPLDIGARRFARGEITKDEYETLRATLRS